VVINYEDIPIHLRCTNRHLINPDYPGDNAFWRFVDVVAKRDHARPNAYHAPKAQLSDNAKAMVDIMIERGEYPKTSFGKDLQLTEPQVMAAINNMGNFYPTYQTRKGNRVYFGILGITDVR
jgi:hypothetical protein